MKKLLKISSVLMLTSFLFTACKKQISEIQYLGGTPSVLTASSTAAVVLLPANANNNAISFSWTNPEYKFSTGISSQDVTYTLQIDTVGSNFKDINETTIAKDLSVTLTVSDFNKKLLALNVIPGGVCNVELRIKSTLANSTVPLYSNIVKLTVTTYLDFAVTPPGTAPLYNDGKLFLVGSATAGGWNNPVPLPTQQFTKIDATHYKITVPMSGGQEYLMLPVNGDWGTKYGNSCGSNSCNNNGTDNFKMGGDNIKGPSGSGTYTITVNFVSGKFTVN